MNAKSKNFSAEELLIKIHSVSTKEIKDILKEALLEKAQSLCKNQSIDAQ